MSAVKIRIQPYNDAFSMGCCWTVGMKYGDGSALPCNHDASCRVIFDNGGRTMLCAVHSAMLGMQRPEDVIVEPGEAP